MLSVCNAFVVFVYWPRANSCYLYREKESARNTEKKKWKAAGYHDTWRSLISPQFPRNQIIATILTFDVILFLSLSHVLLSTKSRFRGSSSWHFQVLFIFSILVFGSLCFYHTLFIAFIGQFLLLAAIAIAAVAAVAVIIITAIAFEEFIFLIINQNVCLSRSYFVLRANVLVTANWRMERKRKKKTECAQKKKGSHSMRFSFRKKNTRVNFIKMYIQLRWCQSKHSTDRYIYIWITAERLISNWVFGYFHFHLFSFSTPFAQKHSQRIKKKHRYF